MGNFINLFKTDLEVSVMYHLLPQKGKLVYEYNAFRNYRLTKPMFEYNRSLYSIEELKKLFNIYPNYYTKENTALFFKIYQDNIIDVIYLKPERKYNEDATEVEIQKTLQDQYLYPAIKVQNNVFKVKDYLFKYITITEFQEYIKFEASLGQEFYIPLHLREKFQNLAYNTVNESGSSEAQPGWKNTADSTIIAHQPGELTDFITDELQFDLNHPITMIPQYSYDGSVNLILTDGKQVPKLINSRFSATGKNTYEIVDRKGDADTNIYDQGEQFEIDTNLYKSIIKIPKVDFLGSMSGGNMKVGNYHFYFKLADADGNETDFCAESGLVSVFIGEEEKATTGSEDQNSYKLIKLRLSNLDLAYSYVKIYFSRASSQINMNSAITYGEIDKKFIINNKGVCYITITGFETINPKTVQDINLFYNIIENAKTGVVSQNMLFLGNIQKEEIPYKDLADLSLRFLPKVKYEEFNHNVDEHYTILTKDKGYYDDKNIYYKVGYWPDQIYRFGIVYIMKNGELSPVFNIRGKDNISDEEDQYTYFPVYDDKGERNYIKIDEETNLLIPESSEISAEIVEVKDLENSKGVIRFKYDENTKDTNTIFALNIETDENTVNELKNLVKGYFFVRQTRIPTILSQGVTINTNNFAHTPVVSTCNGFIDSIKESLTTSHTVIGDINDVLDISEGFLSRYQYTIEVNGRGLFKKIALIACAVAVAVLGVAAGIFTGGATAAGGVAGALAILGTAGGVTAATVTAIAAGVIAAVGTGVAAIAQGANHHKGKRLLKKENVISLDPGEPINGRNITNRFPEYDKKYHDIKELSSSRKLTHTFTDRAILKDYTSSKTNAIICPDYETDQAFYNSIYTGNDHLIKLTNTQSLNILSLKRTNYFTNGGLNEPNHFYLISYEDYNTLFENLLNNNKDKTEIIETHRLNQEINAKIVGVPDSTPLITVDGIKFRSRAGWAEEAFRIEEIGQEFKAEEDKSDYDNDDDSDVVSNGESTETMDNRKINSEIIRGDFGPYLAYSDKENILSPACIVNIYIPNYSEILMQEYFNIRMHDSSPFQAISDRYTMLDIDEHLTDKNSSLIQAENSNKSYNWELFRGDCYLCQVTHRLNRNFQDPSAPFNDKIVDENSWKDHYDPGDTTTYNDINLGDVNAVKMGMWITFRVRSSKNLNIRTLDYSNVDEMAMTMHPRGYYPQQDMNTDGNYKHPESQTYNNGFQKSLSEKHSYLEPDVPAIKNWFGTRIMYSDIQVNDAFKNGFRVFQGTAYKDYTREYGEITKLVNINNAILVVFEHGISLVTVNPSGPLENLKAGQTYLNTNNVLSDLNVISDCFGSQWQDSILSTPKGVYGVDTVAKKIWFTNGQTLELISDLKVGEFLNNNITLSERELTPILGLKNVKTCYNAYKEDVMFTFYDDTYGVQECVWNLCYNEILKTFITFYSWVPSFMANINNIPFSFDRNTSKWIAKLGQSHSENSFADGITCENVVIRDNLLLTEDSIEELLSSVKDTPHYTEAKQNLSKEEYYDLGELTLSNKVLPEGLEYKIEFEKGKYDSFRTLQYIEIINVPEKILVTGGAIGDYIIKNHPHLMVKANRLWEIKSELYYRNTNETHVYPDWDTYKDNFSTDDVESYFDRVNGIDPVTSKRTSLPIFINRNHQRLCRPRTNGYMKHNQAINPDKIVTLLPLKATIYVKLDEEMSMQQAYYMYTEGTYGEGNWANAGSYESMTAITPEWNLQFLSTDFWKHGFAGIVDIADKIYPCYWYGKQHPFEFEVIVVDKPDQHKVFNNLMLIANKAKPESFHYEVIGEAYEFSNDKLNAYYRQEALKALWQANGADICYNNNFLDLQPEQNEVSIDLPHSYVARQDTINDVEDYYITATSTSSKDYRYLSGGEISYYPNRQEFRYCNHIKGISFNDFSEDDPNSLIHSNMRYLEDKWYINIPPLYILFKNEYKATNYNAFHTSTWMDPNRPSLLVKNSPIPTKAYEQIKYNDGTVQIPKVLEDIGYQSSDIDFSNWRDSLSIYQMGNYGEGQNLQSVPMRDRFIKIKVRYTGDELAIIDFLNTLYTTSYA